MRIVFYLYFLFLTFTGPAHGFSQQIALDTVRKMFLFSMEDDVMNAELYRYLSKRNFSDNNALMLAYKGSSRTIMARSASWPAIKYKYFTEGRNMIEKAILLQPSHPEIRFLRLMIQLNIPSYLKYNHQEEDCQFLVHYFGKNRPTKGSFEETMVNLIRKYGKLSASQEAMLDKGS